jgi:hypothetical protein
VTEWASVWLGVMAIALVVMAAIQVGLIVMGLRLVRQMSATIDGVRRDVKPLIDKAHVIADEAARATTLATMQVERVDQLLSSTTARVDEAVGLLQSAFAGPLRQGAAVVTAVRAIAGALRQWQDRRPSRSRREEEDALFVG